MFHNLQNKNPEGSSECQIATPLFYEIELLESLIQDFICNTLEECSNASALLDLRNLEDQLKKSVIRTVFELKKDRLIEFYIKTVHNRLVCLSNKIYINSGNTKSGYRKKLKNPIFPDLQENIDSLISFLLNSFEKYIGSESLITLRAKDQVVLELKKQIENSLLNQKSELLSIVIHSIKDFIYSNQPASYHHINYLNLLTRELTNLDLNDLKTRLIEINFNSFSFLHYLTHEIVIELEGIDSIPGKLEKLLWHLKKVKQIQVFNYSYVLSRKSIKELFIDWINEEIIYLEKSMAITKLPKELSNNLEENDFKLLTDLSVSQLGFLIRVFIDSGLFKNENDRAIAKFFAQHTKTKGSSEISPGNLLNKFYDVNGNVEEVVKGIIIKMLNQIQKY